MSKDLNRQKQLFDAALEHDAPLREAWLRRACGGDEELLVAVWELVKAHEAAGSFLATPESIVQRQLGVGLPPAPEPATEQPGQLVGGYKLLEQLGEGGFGTVWMAQQEQPVRRLVALKVLKAGMDSAQVVARFEQERQALAVMQHPNVAQVYDAGMTAAGRPFFVMELVKGVPVTDYCTRERLSVAARLQLFVQVCRAVQHAHGKGLIHRDIKPRNVLVATHDGKPLAKVIDFGIAKATGARLTDRTLFTEHRAMVGTLEYMSPEQAEGLLDIDTRADVYSLGALLYELLTGGTPFEGRKLLDAGLAEMLRVLREVEPQRPSLRISSQAGAGWAGGAGRAVGAVDPKSLFGALRGDLDWVVMKALEKDRARRYASADGLAEDVERYLAGDPVLAVPPSLGYRVKKFARRHRAAVSAAAVGLVAVLGSSVAVGVSWRNGEVARVRAEGAESRETTQREAARFASYGSTLRSAIENAVAGNRAMALLGLQACEDSLRGWEWRYARSVAEDSVRFGADDVIGWGANPAGDRLVVMQSESKKRPVEKPNDEGGTTQTFEYDTSDRLVLVDAASGSNQTIMDFPVVVGTTPWLQHRPWLSGDGQSILLAPSPTSYDSEPQRGGRIAVLDVATRSWRLNESLLPGSIVAVAKELGAFVVCDSNGDVTCRRISSSDIVWRLPLVAANPIDVIVCDEGRLVVLLCEAKGTRGVAIRVMDGFVEWSQDFPAGAVSEEDEGDRVSLAMRWVETPASDSIARIPWVGSDVPILLVDVHSGDVSPALMQPLSLIQAQVHGIAMACDMMDRLEGRPSSLVHRLRMSDGYWVPKRFADGGVRVMAKRFGATAIFMGTVDSDVFMPGVLGSSLYRDGINDMCLPTLELRIHPRRYAGMNRTSLSSGYAVSESLRRIGLFADRAADVFPPRPLGDECSVTSLGLWKGQPAAIYTGGITTLNCDDAVRLPIEGGPFPIDGAASSVDGSHLVVASASSLRVLDTATGEDSGKAIALEGTARAVAVTPTGANAVSLVEAADGSLALSTFAVEDGRTVHRVSLPAAVGAKPHCELAAGNLRLAVAVGDAPVRLFTLPDLREIQVPLAAAMSAAALSFSPNADLLAIGRRDGRVDMLAADGSLTSIPNAHVGGVLAVVWSSDGSRLFTAGADGFVRLWDPVRGIELLNLGDNSIPGQPGFRAFEGLPCCLFATPDGERLFCGYTDGAVRVWDTVPWLDRVARRRQAEADAAVRAPK